MNQSRSDFRLLLTGALVVLAVAGIIGSTAAADDEKRYAIGNVVVIGDDEETAYLGVRLREETESSEGGARVTTVIEDSPAEKAGIKEDDVIVRFDGEVIRGPVGLTERIHAASPGDEVSMTVIRDGRKQELEVELGDRSDFSFGIGSFSGPGGQVYPWSDNEKWQEWQEQLGQRMKELGERLDRQYGDQPKLRYQFQPFLGWDKPRLGVQLVDTTPELRRHLGGSDDAGVLVGKVLSGTPAQHAGVAVGDLIVSVDGEPVSTVNELVEELREREGETFPLEVIRNRREVTLEVTLPETDDSVPDGPRAMLAPLPPLPRVARDCAPSVPARCAVAPPAPCAAPLAPAPSVVPPKLPAVPLAPLAPAPAAAPAPPRPNLTSV